MSNNYKSIQKIMFRSFGGNTKSFSVGLQVWRVFVLKLMKFWAKHFCVILIKNNKNCNRNNVSLFRVQNQVIMAWFSYFFALVVFMPKTVIKFWPKLFLSLIYVKSPQIYLKNHVRKFWGQNQVIFGWFASLASFRTKSHEILAQTFLCRTDGKW